jgi:sugar phosphate permease
MKSVRIRRKSGEAFHGWYVLVGSMLITFIVGGAFVNTFGVMLPVISHEFGWSRATVSMALSLGMIAFGVPSPLYGFLNNRLGPRFSIILGNLLAALGIAAIYLVQEIWHIYLLYIFIGMVSGLGGYIATSTVVNNWFVKKRSLVMGILTASAGVGGLVFPPVVTALIRAIGWRESWLVLAGMVVIAAVVAGVVLIRNKPEDMGQVPDGIRANPDDAIDKPALRAGNEPSEWRVTQVLKGRTIWLILAFVVANALTMGTMMTHQIAYLEDIGFNPMTAATTMSLMSIFSLVGSLGFGTLALRINIRYLASAGFLCQVVSIIILLTTRNLGLIFVYAALMGISTGALFTAMPTFVGNYYPRERYTQVTSIILPFHVVAQAVAAYAVGAIYDITAEYTLAFFIIGALPLIGLVCAFSARPPKQ